MYNFTCVDSGEFCSHCHLFIWLKSCVKSRNDKDSKVAFCTFSAKAKRTTTTKTKRFKTKYLSNSTNSQWQIFLIFLSTFFQGCVNIFMMNSVGETLRYETWYWYVCKRSACILAKISQRNLIQMNFHVSTSYNIALKILARKIKYMWQLTGFYPLILVVLLLFFYLVVYILCLLLIYFLLCAVY